jgi:Fe2+ or Zn2+ uptake regulation protein
MITGFKDAETEKVFNGIRSRRFEAIASTAYRKLAFLHSAGTLHDLRSPGLHLEALRATGPASTASGSTTGIGFVSCGGMAKPPMSRLWIIIRGGSP